jgi:hypothetical protein
MYIYMRILCVCDEIFPINIYIGNGEMEMGVCLAGW